MKPEPAGVGSRSQPEQSKIDCCEPLNVPSWLRRAKEEYEEPSGMGIDLLFPPSDELLRIVKHPQNNPEEADGSER